MSTTLRARPRFFPRARALIAALVLAPALFVAAPAYADIYVLGGGGGGGGGETSGSFTPGGGGAGGGGAGGYIGSANLNGKGGNGGDGAGGAGGGIGGDGGITGSNGAGGGGSNAGGNGGTGNASIGGAVAGNGGRGGNNGNSTGDTGATGAPGTGNGGGGGGGGAGTSGVFANTRGAGGGGGGGGATLALTTFSNSDHIRVQGGNGGAGGAGTLRGKGGNGGSASLTVPLLTVNNLTVASGVNSNIATGGGLGGAASLGVENTLTASGNITLTKSDAALTANIGTLAVAGTNVNLTLNNTVAGNVAIHGLSFGGGSALDVQGVGGMTFAGNLSVSGLGNSLLHRTFIADGHTVTFNLDNTMTNGATMLSGPIQLNATTTFAIDATGGLPNLAAEQSIVLIDGYTGSPNASALPAPITYPGSADRLVFEASSSQLTATRKRTAAVVTLQGNGGTTILGGLSSSDVNTFAGATLQLSDYTDTFTRTYYTLTGWNTAGNGTGTPYDLSDPFVVPLTGSPHTLHAIWQLNTYTVTYEEGTPSGAMSVPPPVSDVGAGTTYRIDPTPPTLLNYTFDGWMSSDTSNSGPHDPSDDITMPDAPLTLTAQWKINKYTVTYDGGHIDALGTPPQDDDVEAGSDYTVKGPPTLANYTFAGWLRSDNNTIVNPGDHIYPMPDGLTSLMLTAQWTFNGIGTAKNIPLTPAAGLLLMMLGIAATAGVATRRRKVA